MLSTDTLLKASNKDLKRMEATKLSADGAVAAATLSDLVEDVQDMRRPLDRCLRTRKGADGSPLTAADTWVANYFF